MPRRRPSSARRSGRDLPPHGRRRGGRRAGERRRASSHPRPKPARPAAPASRPPVHARGGGDPARGGERGPCRSTRRRKEIPVEVEEAGIAAAAEPPPRSSLGEEQALDRASEELPGRLPRRGAAAVETRCRSEEPCRGGWPQPSRSIEEPTLSFAENDLGLEVEIDAEQEPAPAAPPREAAPRRPRPPSWSASWRRSSSTCRSASSTTPATPLRELSARHPASPRSRKRSSACGLDLDVPAEPAASEAPASRWTRRRRARDRVAEQIDDAAGARGRGGRAGRARHRAAAARGSPPAVAALEETVPPSDGARRRGGPEGRRRPRPRPRHADAPSPELGGACPRKRAGRGRDAAEEEDAAPRAEPEPEPVAEPEPSPRSRIPAGGEPPRPPGTEAASTSARSWATCSARSRRWRKSRAAVPPARARRQRAGRHLQGVQEGRRQAARQGGLRHPLQPRHRLQGDGPHRRGHRRVPARGQGRERGCSSARACSASASSRRACPSWPSSGSRRA